MTKDQATDLQLKWKQRAYPIPCEHQNLELERTGEGHPTGKYVCILCGKLVAQIKRAA